jgi:hypothetical protein
VARGLDDLVTWEYGMKFFLTSTALGAALAAGATVAQAQTAITTAPVAAVPAATELVQTETVRTVWPAPSRAARRQIVTTRTVTRQVVPAPAVIAGTVPDTPQPLYDVVTQPLANPDNTPALYDTAVPVAPATPLVAAPFAPGTAPFIYRYVYEPDRILVIDPNTGVAVQAIPR